MKTLPVYITAKRWSRPLLEALAGHAAGVVLGDLFCQKRMFENEWFDVVEYARAARNAGIQVIFQTPAYNTTRTMETTISLLYKLAADGLLDAVLAHDIGVIQALRKFDRVELWWDRFSFNRDFVPNAYLIDFLIAHRVSRVEVVRSQHVSEVAGRGCGVLLYSYGPDIASFGRICYTEYFLEEPCERKILCNHTQPFIASVDKVPLQYVADGYTLLDKDNPNHSLPQLSSDLALKVEGITAYIHNHKEIVEVDKVVAALARSQGG